MKVTLDLAALVASGRLSKAEADRLQALAVRDAGSLGINVILSFGVVAVVAAAGVLVPSAATAIALGAILMFGGIGLGFTQSEAWGLLGRTCTVIGTLLFWGGLAVYVGTSALTFGLMSLGVAAVAVIARSGLLAALAILGFGGAVSTGFGDVSEQWWIFSPKPTVSIVVFTLLALGLLFASLKLPRFERLAIIAARTSVLVVGLAFLFASVFGDGNINREFFAIGFAVLLVAVAAWAVRVDRRWLINAAAVFGAIHFLVQWFFYLGANALSVLGGGVLMIAFGLALFAFNRRRLEKAAKPAQ